MKKITNKDLIIIILAVLVVGLFAFGWHKIEQSRKVYIYSLDEVLLKTNMVEAKQKLDTEIVALNKELLSGEKKIKSLKDAKVKLDFSEVYLKNLRMKRDELVENYKKSVEEITQKINVAMQEVIKEKKINVVFFKNAVAADTPYVIDITNDIIEKIKK